MVVRDVTSEGRLSCVLRRLLRALAALLALFGALLPTATRSQSLPLFTPPAARASTFGQYGDTPSLASQLRIFDPAQSVFNSLLSYGAMRVIAPIVFGDFASPTALSSILTYAGPMSPNATFDPAVSTALNGTFQEALLQAGGPAEAEEFGVGPSDVPLASISTGGGGAGPPGGYAATPGETPSLALFSEAGKISPACADDETAKALQAGGKFWGPQTVSAPLARFPGGVISGFNIGNPLGDLGPTGNPTNLSATGPAGSWCRPGLRSFYLTSPLEEPFVWIVFGFLTTGALVFFLSRGVRLPT
jgi:hypothetical protein